MTERQAHYEIMNGNELIVQGGLEAGFSLYTGYPGSPLADFFNILNSKESRLKERGIRVAIANSEANAAAMASGSKQAGRDCLIAMKSMGLHVASDALSVGNFANPGEPMKDPDTGEMVNPGVVVTVGDDPWSISTSTPADSRFLFKHLHIPFLEPSTPQELKDWMKHALWISRRTSLYQGVLLTTFMAEGGGRVKVGEEAEVPREAVTLDPSTFNLQKNVMVPPNSLVADQSMITERFPKVRECLKQLNLDQTFGPAEGKIGFITSGVIFETVKQVMEEGGYLDRYPLYKVAASYPLIEDFLVPWLDKLDHLIVVEEKRSFLETELSELCQKHGINLTIYGKQFRTPGGEYKDGFPAYGGLNYEIIRDKTAELLKDLGETPCSALYHEGTEWEGTLPKRLPTFCPGCPHRETLSLLKDLRKKFKNKGVDLISHGDVGCYSLSFLPPFKEMHNLSAMGQGGALGAGVDLFSTNPSVVLMGDSTFFHSGMTDVSNSLQCGHNITYILLDNDNTAMTGHQMTPVTGISVEGEKTPQQDMLSVAKSLGVEQAVEVNPSDRYFYKNLLEEYIEKPGVKVIVSNKECALTYHARLKKKERSLFKEGKTEKVKSFYQINTEACEDCRACVEATGCPGLSQTFDAYGSKVMIDPQICVSDSYCTKIKACPSFERVDVFDYHPTKFQKGLSANLVENLEKESEIPLPDVAKSFDDLAEGEDLRVVVTGVGGSGVTTISKVLSRAAREMNGREDMDFKFMDQKGLAQRNGNVTAHLAIYKKGSARSAVTPKGTADLVLSPDLLDGSQHIDFLAPSGQAIFGKKFQIPVSLLLDRGEEKEPLTQEALQKQIRDKLGERVSLASLKDISNKVLGKSVYASAMILGLAFQSGRLPFSLENMREAFGKAVPKLEFENNWKAFQLGRRIWSEGDEKVCEEFGVTRAEDERHQVKLLEKSLEKSFLPWQSTKLMMKSFHHHFASLKKYFPEIRQSYLARYLHDIYVFDRGRDMDQFIDDAIMVKELYTEENERAMALRALVKTYFVKDEIFASHLMLSPLQKEKDQNLYGGLGKSFQKTHINRPSFDVFGKHIEFDIHPKDWMLAIMRHMRILRLILPGWHKKEREISRRIRQEIVGPLSKVENGKRYHRLKQLENVKGYREIRYEKADEVFGTDEFEKPDPSFDKKAASA